MSKLESFSDPRSPLYSVLHKVIKHIRDF